MNKRLLDYLNSRSKIIRSTGCKEWQFSSGSHGYGQGFWNGRVSLAHRLSWEAHKGPIPKDRKILHRCDNRRCIKIGHLFLGTDLDNCLDKLSKSRGGYGPQHSRAIAIGIRATGRTSISDSTAREVFMATGRNVDIARRLDVPEDVVSNIRRRTSYKFATEGLTR